MIRFFPSEGDPSLPMQLAGIVFPAFNPELETLGSEHARQIIAAAAVKNCYYETDGARPIAYGAIHTGNLDVGQVGFSDICVAPDLQGQGIGRQFVRNLEVTAGRLGGREVRLIAGKPELIEFYTKLGYVLTDSSRRMGKTL